nr:uncharacterized mitochondrial protein AtMg00810-like [Tanacetum cinerariifolium]
MKDRFQMSYMGELTFFLGLQVKQKEDGIFISQDKYVTEVLRKFNLSDVKIASTLVDTEKPLVKDADGDDIDVHLYRSIIGSLMYLTASRPDIMSSIRQKTKVPQSSSPTHTHVADEAASTSVDVRHGRAATTTYPKRRAVSTGSGGVSTASKMISTSGASMPINTTGMVDKEEAMRLQEQFDEEERQKISRVHEAAQTFTDEEWENIRARVEAAEELTQRLQAEERDKSKKQKIGESSEPRNKDVDELSQEELQQLMIIVPEQGMNVEALQTKCPIIDWDIYTEDIKKYWKIIRVGNHTKVYQFLEDMLKIFDMDDLVMLWPLVKERFSSTEPTNDKERVLWVELKRLFEPDTEDELWKLQRHMHDPLT